MENALPLSQVATELGVAKALLYRESKRADFPAPESVRDGVGHWFPSKVSEWRVTHIKTRARKEKFSTVEPSIVVVELSSREVELVAILRDPARSPLEKLRAGYEVASLSIARGVEKGALPARALDDMKRQSEELRKCEADELLLAQRRDDLIPRDDVKALLGECGRLMVGALDLVVNEISLQVDRWNGDAEFVALPTEERQRKVREWAEERVFNLRHHLSQEMKDMLVEARAE
jgi:predicted DNA-binding transcriptional regulator AlpA